jgi:hypothetical protein
MSVASSSSLRDDIGRPFRGMAARGAAAMAESYARTCDADTALIV